MKGNYNIPTLGKVFQTWILPLPPHISNSCNLGLFLIIQASVWYLEKNVSNLSSINNDMRSLENYPVSCFVHFGHLMQRTDSLGEILMLEKIEGRRGWQDEIVGWHHWLDGHEFMSLRSSWSCLSQLLEFLLFVSVFLLLNKMTHRLLMDLGYFPPVASSFITATWDPNSPFSFKPLLVHLKV